MLRAYMTLLMHALAMSSIVIIVIAAIKLLSGWLL